MGPERPRVPLSGDGELLQAPASSASCSPLVTSGPLLSCSGASVPITEAQKSCPSVRTASASGTQAPVLKLCWVLLGPHQALSNPHPHSGLRWSSAALHLCVLSCSLHCVLQGSQAVTFTVTPWFPPFQSGGSWNQSQTLYMCEFCPGSLWPLLGSSWLGLGHLAFLPVPQRPPSLCVCPLTPYPPALLLIPQRGYVPCHPQLLGKPVSQQLADIHLP